MSEAYRNLATGCQAIFNCQREIAEFVPAVSTQDVTKMVYKGKPHTSDRVEQVRRSLETPEMEINGNGWTSLSANRRRRSEPKRHVVEPLVSTYTRDATSSVGIPPPPYTPSAPRFDDIDRGNLV